MKRLAVILIVLFAATSLFAGGKECNKATSTKSVELTGTLVKADDGSVFRVANSDQSYKVCEKTKAAVLKAGNGGKDTLRVSGKLISCGEGEELIIESAKKI